MEYFLFGFLGYLPYIRCRKLITFSCIAAFSYDAFTPRLFGTFFSLDNIVFVWGLVKAYSVGDQTSQLCSSKTGSPGLSQANPSAVTLWCL